MSSSPREQATNQLPMGVPAWLAPRALSCHARQASGVRIVGQRRVSVSQSRRLAAISPPSPVTLCASLGYTALWRAMRRRRSADQCDGIARAVRVSSLVRRCSFQARSRKKTHAGRNERQNHRVSVWRCAWRGTVFRQSPFVKRRAWMVQRQPWPIPWTFTVGMCRGVSPNTRGHQVFEPASDPFKGFSRA